MKKLKSFFQKGDAIIYFIFAVLCLVLTWIETSVQASGEMMNVKFEATAGWLFGIAFIFGAILAFLGRKEDSKKRISMVIMLLFSYVVFFLFSLFLGQVELGFMTLNITGLNLIKLDPYTFYGFLVGTVLSIGYICLIAKSAKNPTKGVKTGLTVFGIILLVLAVVMCVLNVFHFTKGLIEVINAGYDKTSVDANYYLLMYIEKIIFFVLNDVLAILFVLLSFMFVAYPQTLKVAEKK